MAAMLPHDSPHAAALLRQLSLPPVLRSRPSSHWTGVCVVISGVVDELVIGKPRIRILTLALVVVVLLGGWLRLLIPALPVAALLMNLVVLCCLGYVWYVQKTFEERKGVPTYFLAALDCKLGTDPVMGPAWGAWLAHRRSRSELWEVRRLTDRWRQDQGKYENPEVSDS